MFRLLPETKIILYIGSLAVSSGHRVDHLLAVWDELAANDPNLHLVCAGSGIHAETLQAQTSSLRFGARVHFSGRYKAGEAQGLVKQATLLVDPVDDTAAARAKSSSRMLLALLTGVPIVAGDVGIRRDMLPAPCRLGALYAPGNPAELLPALRHGLTPAAREQFSEATRNTWQRWSWETVGNTFAALVENAVR
jgi:glycosyltransferase involved in cell wall biosynthesis